MARLKKELLRILPHTIILTSEEVEDALKKSANMIVNKVKNVLEQTPPELASDIINKGIILTGGGALTVGLDKLLENELKVPVKIAESPLTCVSHNAKTYGLWKHIRAYAKKLDLRPRML